MKTSSRESPISSSIWFSSWPARPTKGRPWPVLFGPGRLADEHQLGVGVAGPEDRLGAGLVQGASGAGLDFLVEVDQLVPPLLGRCAAHLRRTLLRGAALTLRTFALVGG